MAVAEPRRRRDRGSDRVDELAGALERLLAPAADDPAGDLLRVPLLAVAAEDRHEVALAPVVDDVATALVLARIHPHVERRVDRVREATLGPVELHRGDAEIEQDRVGTDAVSRQLRQNDAKVAPQETRVYRRALRELLEVRPRRRVAVDR